MLQSSDAERLLPAIRLRNISPTRWQRWIRASLLLWAGPTSPSRSSSATASGLPDAVPTTTGGTAMEISRFPGGRLLRMPGVCDDAGPARISRSRHGPSRLLLDGKHQRPELVLRRSIPSLRTPLSRLGLQPHDRTRITRGRCGSLHLHRNGVAPSTFRRSPGAPVHHIKSGPPTRSSVAFMAFRRRTT